MKIYPNDFCPDPQFVNTIVNVLNTHLLQPNLSPLPSTASAINNLKGIYKDMRIHCDHPDIEKKYMFDGNCVKVNTTRLTTNEVVYAGHDLPVWINSPKTDVKSADCRIMIVGRDPGRMPIDMYEIHPTRDQITICSPFGMHCRYHRRKMEIIPHMVNEIIRCANKCNKTVSVYITDFYKFKRVASSAIDTPNKIIYNDVLEKEIGAFKPHVIIPLGKQVMSALGINKRARYFSFNKASYKYPIPHPSGNNSREIAKVKQELGVYNQDDKSFFADQVCKALKTLCCKASS